VAWAVSAAAETVSIIPRPVSVRTEAGHFTLAAGTIIWSDPPSAAVAYQLARYLEPPTGFTLRVEVGGTVPDGAIALRHDPSLTRVGAEGYTLAVRSSGVEARAPELAGLFYAVQTIRQLLPPAILRDAPAFAIGSSTDWSMPAVTIEDQPRFAWRGGHLDSARHFMPKEFVKKYIDLLALHKLNTFHWHLTDDQGWRIEIKQYPRLTGIGSCRNETIVGRQSRDETQWKFDGTAHCGFYTQDDLREIVAYAKARYVTIVPEIEMPGHAVAAIAAYPELGVTGDRMEVATRWGVFSDIFNAEPGTLAFLQNVLAEVIQIFPGRYIHVGGDEADKTKWKTSARIQTRIKELDAGDERGLQIWFIRKMEAFLASHGRRLVGWDEPQDGGLSESAVVMSWRGVDGGIAAARAGHDVVMTPTSHTYFDYYQSQDQAHEPLAIGGFLPLETVYAYEPIPEPLEPQFASRVLGAQGQVWTEYMPTPKQVEYMAFPRLAALAEVVWSPKAVRDYSDFVRRLETHLSRLQALDVNYRPIADSAR
jgi:hexosaminidase